MSRPIRLQWEVNNESLLKSIEIFDELQKKVHEFYKLAERGSENMHKKTASLLEDETAAIERIKKEIQEKVEAEKDFLQILKKELRVMQDIKSSQTESQTRNARNLTSEIKKQIAAEKQLLQAKTRRLKTEKEILEILEKQTKSAARPPGGPTSGGRGGSGGAPPGIPITPMAAGGGFGATLSGAAAAAGAVGMALAATVEIGQKVVETVGAIYSSFLKAAAESEKLQTNLALAYMATKTAGTGFEDNFKLAEQAMLRIQELSAATPFSVNEITDAYIKLTKRGLRPTEEQLLGIGNLASFSGKSIDQLTEAILDAQQGSKERLKEFGIDMKVESGKVKLAIGDIQAEGEKIIETFAKLGQMPGLSESMEKQSQTIQGAFDTLKDNFNLFLTDVGRAPEFMEPMRDIMAGLAPLMEALRLSAGYVAEALGGMARIVVDQLLPPVQALEENFAPLTRESFEAKKAFEQIIAPVEHYTSSVSKSNEITTSFARQISKFTIHLREFLQPSITFIVTIFRKLGELFSENSKTLSVLTKIFNIFKVTLSIIGDILTAIVGAIGDLIEALAGVIDTLFRADTVFGKFAVTIVFLGRIIKNLAVALLDFSKNVLVGLAEGLAKIFRGDFAGAWEALTQKVVKGAKNLTKGVSAAFTDLKKQYKDAEDAIFGEKEIILPEKKKGMLPGGTDLGVETAEKTGKSGAQKEKQLEDLTLLKLERQYDLEREREKQRHQQALIEIEKKGKEARDLLQTLERKKMEENIAHEEKMYEIEKRLAQERYEIEVRNAKLQEKDAEKLKNALEKLDIEHNYNVEKAQILHNTKMLQMRHEYAKALIEEQLALAERERRLEDARLQMQAAALARELETQKALYQETVEIISKNGEILRKQQNRVTLDLIELEKANWDRQTEIQRARLQMQLEIHKKFNNLTIEEEEKLKNEILELEENYAHKRSQLEYQAQRELHELQKYLHAQEKEARQTAIADIKKSLEDGLGEIGKAISAALPDTEFENYVTSMREKIAELRSIGSESADAIADSLERTLDAKIFRQKTQQLANVIGSALSAINELFNKITEVRIAHIDEEIKRNNEEIEQLRAKAELEKQRNEEMLRRQEIDNKLAQQRIEELEALKSSIPESEQALADQQIEIQKARMKDLEKIREESQKKEDERINQIEERNKRLEEEKKRIQREQFEINRAAQIAQTLIQGAVAAINTFSSLSLIPVVGPNLAAAAAAAVGAFTAGQVALIAAQPNPYKKGTLAVEGGERGKDSVPALLEPGEAVLPVAINRDYAPVVRAIFNREIPAYEINHFVRLRPALRQKKSAQVAPAAPPAPSVYINIDEDGFEKYIDNYNEKTKILNKKLLIKK